MNAHLMSIRPTGGATGRCTASDLSPCKSTFPKFVSAKPAISPKTIQYSNRRLCGASEQEASTSGNDSASQSWDLLNKYTKLDIKGLSLQLRDSSAKRNQLRTALLAAYASMPIPEGQSHRDVLLAVLASDVRLAMRSLRDYCQALDLPFVTPECRVPGATALPLLTGPVFLKYNATSGTCYAIKYEGKDRGVLVQLAQQQVGHLPLGLFDEEMSQPPPIV